LKKLEKEPALLDNLLIDKKAKEKERAVDGLDKSQKQKLDNEIKNLDKEISGLETLFKRKDPLVYIEEVKSDIADLN